ncbi:MAG: glycosyltransferase [Actinobacteria bacterium]|nr:glycosyltransferase [Actinomycetota bacterium]
MLEGKDIVFVSGVDWRSNPSSQIQISLRLGKHNRVLFVNPAVSILTPIKAVIKGTGYYIPPHKQLSGNITILAPRLLPFKDSRFGNRFSRGLRIRQIKDAMRELNFKDPILIVGGARPETLGHLGEKLSVYHCNDDYSAGTEYMGVPYDWLIKREREVLSKVDLVMVVSPRLLEKKSVEHGNVFCVPTGCDAAHFEKAADGKVNLPPEIASIKRPIIGFMGHINNRIDFDLIYDLATLRPNWSFIFIGGPQPTVDKVKLKRLESLDNIHMLGFKPKEVLPDYVRAFDVCLIPYADDEFNRSCSPIKLYEYLATGKPTVSIPIPALEEFKELIYLASGGEEFLDQIERALSESDKELQVVRMSVARQNDWNARAELYSDIIQRCLENK